MNKLRSYSKYQKNIIKSLGKELGSTIPFKFEKTKNNHLKVLIDGLDRPFYTACTPSDRKSGVNFIGDVRSALKMQNISPDVTVRPVKLNTVQHLQKSFFDKVIDSCLRNLRSTTSTIAKREKKVVLENGHTNDLKRGRNKIAEMVIKRAKSQVKQKCYLPHSENLSLNAQVLQHLDYMLPPLAYYAELLKETNLASNKDDSVIEQTIEQKLPLTSVDTLNSKLSTKPNIESKPTHNIRNIKVNTKIKNPSVTLASLDNEDQIDAFMSLDRITALRFIDNIKIAMNNNRQKDLNEISLLMENKGLTLEMLADYIEEAA